MKDLTYKDLFNVPTLKTTDYMQHMIYTNMLAFLRAKLKACVWSAQNSKYERTLDIALQGFTTAVTVYNIWAENSNAPYMRYAHILEIEKMIIELWKREGKDHE